MGYSPWGHKELDTAEWLTLSFLYWWIDPQPLDHGLNVTSSDRFSLLLLQHLSRFILLLLCLNVPCVFPSWCTLFQGFPGGSMVKNPPANSEDAREESWILGLGISPGVENGNTLHSPCLENSRDKGNWWATVHGIGKQSDSTDETNMKHLRRCNNYICT